MLHPNQLNETGRIASVYRLSETTVRMDVLAPLVAKSALPGQFIIFRTHKTGERIPLTIADINSDKISLIFQEAGYSTKKLGAMKPGDKIEDLLGPLGQPSVIEKFGTVVAVGGGVGAAVLYPEVKALKAAGNRIITIIGARSKELIILEKELGDVSDSLYVTTDDGSLGEKGLVTDLLKKILESEKTDLVLAIGPIVMMKYVSLLTKTFNVKTIVSLNPIMVDGTGMCGACRVDIDGKTKFACVDGPEFDGHQVNYDILMQRNRQYEEVEKLKS
jgi:ferredoxin--NADP+ reductase